MIGFHRIGLEDQTAYETILMSVPERGCEYSFAKMQACTHEYTYTDTFFF